MRDMDKLLKCREAIDSHKKRKWNGDDKVLLGEELKKSVSDYMKVLNNNGFKTLDEFNKYNEERCFEEYEKKRPIKGECDKCIGYEGKPPCLEKYGEKSCYIKMSTLEEIQKLAFNFYVTNSDYIKVNKYGCPEGHGFYLGEVQDLDFDVCWKL
jgi:hypothetical protein